MQGAISGILFDIGGVLVALDGVPYLTRALQLEESHDEMHRRWLACPSVVAHETGRMSAEEFAAALVDDLNLPVAPDEFLLEFGAWLQGPHPGAFELVDGIPGQYRVAALSNMSAFHWTRIAAMGWPSRFDAVYLSCQIGHLKPSVEAFQVAFDGMKLPAAEVLFLDDGQANVAAARALGMEAQLVRGPEEVRLALEEYGVLPKGAGNVR
jgi:putative hydrolase of the HAD superfamily